jgi:hypothetical protein
MSSPASRRRQRQRRRARERIWTIQSQLAERKADLAAYKRVLADIDKCIQGGMPLLSAEQLAVVIALQDKVRRNCEELVARVVAAESIAAPETSDSAENISA